MVPYWKCLEERCHGQEAIIESMASILTRMEWALPWGGCFICGNTKFSGGEHKPDCELNAVLSRLQEEAQAPSRK